MKPMRQALLSIFIGSWLLASCQTAPASNSESAGVNKAAGKTGSYTDFAMPSAALDAERALSRISFSSCLQEWGDMEIWGDIQAEQSDLFIFLGDNVYGDEYPDRPGFDDPDMPKMLAAYEKLADSSAFANFRAQTPLLTTWDDHDYGLNDGGAAYKFKSKAKELFLTAWDAAPDDPRRSREGLYGAHMIGPVGERVQIILLDTRYFRGELTVTDEKDAKGKERYVPSKAAEQIMLGAVQWSWLEAELKKPAELRLLVSSVQVIADGHGWEAWKMLPKERQRLYDLLKTTGAHNTVIISGDRHAGAIYRRDDASGFPLLEITASSLNAPVSKWKKPGDTYIEPGPHRLTPMQDEVNYGLLDIDWKAQRGELRLVSPGQETWQNAFSFNGGVISDP